MANSEAENPVLNDVHEVSPGFYVVEDGSQPMPDETKQVLDPETLRFMGISDEPPAQEGAATQPSPPPAPATPTVSQEEIASLKEKAAAAETWRARADQETQSRLAIERERDALKREAQEAALPEDVRQGRQWLRDTLKEDPTMILDAVRPLAPPPPPGPTPEQQAEIRAAKEWVEGTFKTHEQRSKAIALLPALHDVRRANGFKVTYGQAFEALGQHIKEHADILGIGMPGSQPKPKQESQPQFSREELRFLGQA
ncbi:MAG TPA: hypothetical protein VLT62_14040 [Candidatus Methylomirabilis sp.]|nr:hypothetical protein [Candidatus Methylomirabilis sp.]